MPLSPSQIAQAVSLVEQGMTHREVATILNVPRSSMQYALKRYQQTGLCTRRPGSGGVRCTSARDDRFIVLETLRNRFLTAVEIQQRLQISRNVNVSERTVRRRMEEVNSRARRPARGPQLLPQHRAARLQFAREHANWSHEQWARVLFTDECRIALNAPDGRQRVWRRKGERYLAITTTPTVSFGGGSIMIWGGVSSDARTELVIVNNALTATRYIEDILQEHDVPFGGPDLNPIEHIWDKLKRTIKTASNPPQTLSQLRDAALTAWRDLSQLDIKNVIQSMPDRMQAVIRARGGNTRY
ncbi:unnamed protein product [Euphydryas editha]|uniref:Transposase Tc1-like domain-containing protein n=1 Tax=Euphydryas editha TaxID=104508 RepID=A0AAU9TPE8_EUPED|nr:unnamed protein product [Euphydryas editha]